MPTTYPYPYPDSKNLTEDPIYIFNYLNQVSSQWFGWMILIGIYFLILYGYYKATDELAAGMAIAGFVTFVVCLLFWIAGFVSGWTLIITISVLIVGVMSLLIVSR